MARRWMVLLVALAACDDAGLPPIAGRSEPVVWAYLYRLEYPDRTVEYVRDVQVIDVHGFRAVPVVMLNADTLRAYSYRPTEFRYGDGNPVALEQRYDLAVEHFWGRAFSRVAMPGNFTVQKPANRFVLNQDSALEIVWSRATAAQWYWVELYVDYDYYDSTGNWDDFSLVFDTLVYTNRLVLSPQRLFPAFVGEVIEGDGSVVVWAGSGPAVEPGDMGNVRGAGYGFFTAINEPPERYFYVVSPPARLKTKPTRATLPLQRSEKLRTLLMVQLSLADADGSRHHSAAVR